MINKPFRPPFLKVSPAESDQRPLEPPYKRRRITPESTSVPKPYSKPSDQSGTQQSIPRSSVTDSSKQSENSEALETFYNVLWRKCTTKKHKTWDGDGVLKVSNGYASLRDAASGSELGRTPCTGPLLPGSTLSVGVREVEVDSLLSKEEYLTVKPAVPSVPRAAGPTIRELEESLRTNVKFNAKLPSVKSEPSATKPIPVASRAVTNASSQFKTPLLDKTSVPSSGSGEIPLPRHDPSAPGSLVMKRPKNIPVGKQVVDVVVDPILSKHLREHQREGIKFLYECIMGMRTKTGEGAILADEMGLGKTLQVIALLWTLLKQNPVYGEGPLIKKALIVCPVTLIKNWRREFRKWLGNERLGVFVMDGNKTRITDFTHGRSYSIMVIGYEKLRTVQNDLQKGAPIDVVVADEGHRLKTAQNKSAQAIKSLNTEKRIILSGTPLQNDLSEFFFMVDFVNSGLLGKANAFKREFETPILKGRQPDASAKEIEKGEDQSKELASLTSTFILRRTAEILAQYLPSRTEHILFCKPTTTQAMVYRKVLNSPLFNAVLGCSEAALQLINVLKKLCNSPTLLATKDKAEPGSENIISSLLSEVPSSLLNSPGASGKLQVLDTLLHHLRTTTDEKVVLVSHYTSTLDILGNLLDSLSYRWLRLDGSTSSAQRQTIVDKFNRTDAATCFVFLLSAKSGGAGLNLIGASRLILFDVDWNPSTDLQAMARIHRDGQKRPCHIYRLLTQGALDEKIYQRQLTKLSLADSVIDNKMSATNFTREELRNLFSLNESSRCQTHELLGCQCEGRGILPDAEPTSSSDSSDVEEEEENDHSSGLTGIVKVNDLDMDLQERMIKNQSGKTVKKSSKAKMMALMEYQHIDTAILKTYLPEEVEPLIEDDVLLDVVKKPENRISYIFSKTFSCA